MIFFSDFLWVVQTQPQIAGEMNWYDLGELFIQLSLYQERMWFQPLSFGKQDLYETDLLF